MRAVPILLMMRNNNTVAKVLDAGKDALRRLQRRRFYLEFLEKKIVADATANYRSKIGQPFVVQRLPAKTPATIERFIVDPFSFYREVCVVSILIYFARQTATAKRRRHRQRKERDEEEHIEADVQVRDVRQVRDVGGRVGEI